MVERPGSTEDFWDFSTTRVRADLALVHQGAYAAHQGRVHRGGLSLGPAHRQGPCQVMHLGQVAGVQLSSQQIPQLLFIASQSLWSRDVRQAVA